MLPVTIAAVLLAVPTFWLVMRYNLHMFQLNTYLNNEQWTWIRKNPRKQALLALSGVLGLPALALPGVVTAILVVLSWLGICKYYGYLKKSNVKKKLVFTKRVQRQAATDIALNLLLLAAAWAILGWEPLPGVLALLIPLQAIMPMVVNVVNRPMEKAVNDHFIHDAERKLKEVPGLTIIGVTGSYGKTSVKFYLQTLLQEKFNVLVTPESYNTPMGVVKTIRGSLKPTHEIFVCEMGARYVGEIKEICDIVHPHHGVITSIGPQHLETFGSMENITRTKYELADALPQNGMLFLNGDSPNVEENSGKYQNVTFYRSHSTGDGYRAEDIRLSQLGTEFTVVSPTGETERFQTRLVGEHNVINIVGAIAVANRLGIPLRDLKVPVRRIQPVEHRMEMTQHGNVTIIDDAYNSNPVGSKAAVETLALFDGVRILITPGMVELGKEEDEFNYKFGTYAARSCDYILLVGRDHVRPIQKGALDSGFAQDKCRVYDTLEDALAFAYAIRDEGHKYILLENDLPDNY